MAHRISSIDRQEALEQAWHGLTTVKPTLSLDKNWLSTWDIQPAKILLETGRELPFVQLLASDNPDILIGSPYNPATFCPVTNAQFLDMIKASTLDIKHKVVSLGSVRGRGRTFVSMEMEGLEKFKVAGRTFKPFLNFGNGHDRSSVLWANTSNVCTVCDNTFSFNLVATAQRADGSLGDVDVAHQQRHTRHITATLPAAATLVANAVQLQLEFADAFEAMASKPVTSPVAQAFFTATLVKPRSEKIIAPTQEKIEHLVTLFRSGKGNKGENRADAFSAITDYYTHESSGDKAAASQQHFTSEYGTGATYKTHAFGVLSDDDAFAEAVQRGTELMASN